MVYLCILDAICTLHRFIVLVLVIFEWINWHFQKILYYFETVLAGFCQNKLHDVLPCSNNNYGDTSSYLYICSLKAFSFFILKRIIAQSAIEDNCKTPLWFVFNFFWTHVLLHRREPMSTATLSCHPRVIVGVRRWSTLI